MKYVVNTLILILCHFCLFSQTNGLTSTNVNTKYNRVYVKSQKTFEGTLPEDERKKMLNILQNELNDDFTENINILVRYEQKGSNCIKLDGYVQVLPRALKNMDSNNKKLRNKYNTKEYFVYHENSFFANQLKNESNFQLDSGYFKRNIFKLNDNCSAFFILKPNGEFMIQYGEDYMGEVYKYLKR